MPFYLGDGHGLVSSGRNMLVYEEPDVSVSGRAPMLIAEVVTHTQKPLQLANNACVVNAQTDGVSSVKGKEDRQGFRPRR
eukprot:6165865-Alexandrium_andersonii.AAC.1